MLSTYELQTAQNKCMAQLVALLSCQKGSRLKVILLTPVVSVLLCCLRTQSSWEERPSLMQLFMRVMGGWRLDCCSGDWVEVKVGGLSSQCQADQVPGSCNAEPGN